MSATAAAKGRYDAHTALIVVDVQNDFADPDRRAEQRAADAVMEAGRGQERINHPANTTLT